MDTGKSNPAHRNILCYWNTCKTWSSMNCHVIWFLINEKYTNNQGKVQACLPSSAFCIGSTKGLTKGRRYIVEWERLNSIKQRRLGEKQEIITRKTKCIPSYLFRANPFPRYSLFFLFIFQKHFILNHLQQYFIYYVSSPFIHTCQCLMTFCLENKRVGL